MSELGDFFRDKPVELLTPEERAQRAAERAAAPPEPWYDHLVQGLARAQVGTREAHAGLADDWEQLATQVHAALRRIAAHHRALAENVPDAAQAAADLGTAAERHDVNGLRGVLRGEQELRERDVTTILGRLDAIEDGQRRRDERAEQQRQAILDALGKYGEGH